MNTVIFDLDGTLSDSAEGIIRSINYALPKLGFKEQPKEALLQYIGPHLSTIFERLTGIKEEDFILRAITIFRERYFSKGYKENELYEGIKDVLQQLCDRGDILCIATTKQTDIAQNVLRYFEIDKYFTRVQGSDLFPDKADSLKEMISDSALNNMPMIMIGDRDSDFTAAKAAGMPSLAAGWGYGCDDEYKHATAVVEKPLELPEAILQYAARVNPTSAVRVV